MGFGFVTILFRFVTILNLLRFCYDFVTILDKLKAGFSLIMLQKVTFVTIPPKSRRFCVTKSRRKVVEKSSFLLRFVTKSRRKAVEKSSFCYDRNTFFHQCMHSKLRTEKQMHSMWKQMH